MQIKATTTFVEIEGGFWGLLGDDGVPLRPVNGLPADFEKEGLHVQAEVERSNQVSIFMWGRQVELISIELIDK